MASNVLFENITTVDEDVVDYLLDKYMKPNSQQKRFRIFTLCLGVAAAGIALYLFRLYLINKDFTTVACALILSVLCIYCMSSVFGDFTKKRTADYREKLINQLKEPRKYRIYRHTIHQMAGTQHGQYKVADFENVDTYSHYFILKYGKNVIIIDKNGFRTGTAEGFETFCRKFIKNLTF